MLSDSQGQPPALLITLSQFISFFFFCHGHLFQLEPAVRSAHAPLCDIDKMVGRSGLIYIYCTKSEEMESARLIYVRLPAVHRGHHLLRTALCVQEEEREAHRGGDAAGGPSRYE